MDDSGIPRLQKNRVNLNYRLILAASSVRISPMDAAIIGRIAQETSMPESSVNSVVSLFEKGATGPFIIHYRKEATGGMDETKIRLIQERMAHYREVLDQRAALLRLLSEQGKLTDELKTRIESCLTKPELDDLHHQFRPRRKTRATEAIEKGLEPLAEYFWRQETDAWGVEEHINVFVDPSKGVSTQEQALQGVVDIIAEWIWANFEYRKKLREMLWIEGSVVSTVVPAKIGQKTKYNMYYERRESVTTIPSHRVLAIRRGCKEGILISSIEGDNAKAIDFLLSETIKDKESIFAPVLEAAVRESYNRILRPLIETEVRTQLKERADREAIKVFQENLANLLLSPPAGPIVTMGIDWGKGDECSVAVVNENGMYLEGARIRFTPAPKPFIKNPKNSKPEQIQKSPAPEAPEDPIPSQPEVAAEPAPVVDTEAPVIESQEPAQADQQVIFEATVETVAFEEKPAPEVAAEIQPEPQTAEPEPALENAVITEQPAVAPVETVAVEEKPAPEAAAEIQPEPQTAEPEPALENAVITEQPAVAPMTAPVAPETAPAPIEASLTPATEFEEARKILLALIAKYNVQAISIGTGTGARELETALRKITSEAELNDIVIAAVNDAGIAIYSSSRIAREEFPDWNASSRCAVSLARRLQDPLAELVKIDPKLIGVGQYQHDVDQKELHRGLLQTVQYCVNKVGVNINAAGDSLLRYVSGLNEKLARRIIAYRTAQGLFQSRTAIQNAVGMDNTTYEQSAAFLRILGSENPLDRTAVHPESYPIVERMASALGVGINDLIGNKELLSSLKLEDFVTETASIPTLNDIREELLRPGRDPRKTFKAPKFRADVQEMSDLKPGMTLEGTVTNVTNFGAFIDIGVRQDGLVHLSQMSNRFIRDPREAVKVGDVVQVKVISVEPETKRIGLSMKSLMPPIQKRRKKQPRRDTRPQPASLQPGKAPAEIAGGAESAPISAPSKRTSSSENRPRARHDGPARFHKRGARRPENPIETHQKKEEGPKLPEATLQEKIAILQSKFRGIS
jgi:protein Tex